MKTPTECPACGASIYSYFGTVENPMALNFVCGAVWVPAIKWHITCPKAFDEYASLRAQVILLCRTLDEVLRCDHIFPFRADRIGELLDNNQLWQEVICWRPE